MVSRSAVVMTCAYWEAFCEDLAAEALHHLAEHTKDASQLPNELMKSLTTLLRSDQHELAIWKLADEGWRDVLRQRADLIVSDDDRSLNTPKPEQLKHFFRTNIGITDITQAWQWHKNSPTRTRKLLEEFVVLRGSIAHRGSPAGGVLKKHATAGLDLLTRLAERSATRVSEFVEQHSGVGLPELEEQQGEA